MTLEELQSKLPPELKPWVIEYGPIFLAMTGDEIKAWIQRILKGDIEGAYRDVLAKMDNAAFLEEWDAWNRDVRTANKATAERATVQMSALIGLVRIMLVIALAAVGV